MYFLQYQTLESILQDLGTIGQTWRKCGHVSKANPVTGTPNTANGNELTVLGEKNSQISPRKKLVFLATHGCTGPIPWLHIWFGLFPALWLANSLWHWNLCSGPYRNSKQVLQSRLYQMFVKFFSAMTYNGTRNWTSDRSQVEEWIWS